MRIAIPFFEGLIFQHFGHAKQFKIYEIENHQVLMECIVVPEGSGHEAVAETVQAAAATAAAATIAAEAASTGDR